MPINTEVVAVKSGNVTKAGYSESYGYYVDYRTYDGYDIFYAHLNEIKCKQGDVVEQGQVLALSGTTGYSTGPHLHYEITLNNSLLNPSDFVSLK